jgi:hypothetical protein
MVKAWLKHLDNITQLYEGELTSTWKWRLTQKHDVIIHVEEVLEASHGPMDYMPSHTMTLRRREVSVLATLLLGLEGSTTQGQHHIARKHIAS